MTTNKFKNKTKKSKEVHNVMNNNTKSWESLTSYFTVLNERKKTNHQNKKVNSTWIVSVIIFLKSSFVFTRISNYMLVAHCDAPDSPTFFFEREEK